MYAFSVSNFNSMLLFECLCAAGLSLVSAYQYFGGFEEAAQMGL